MMTIPEAASTLNPPMEGTYIISLRFHKFAKAIIPIRGLSLKLNCSLVMIFRIQYCVMVITEVIQLLGDECLGPMALVHCPPHLCQPAK